MRIAHAANDQEPPENRRLYVLLQGTHVRRLSNNWDPYFVQPVTAYLLDWLAVGFCNYADVHTPGVAGTAECHRLGAWEFVR
jgi:hypothetical protein